MKFMLGLLVVLSCEFALTIQQHLICKNVQDVFTERASESINPRIIQGPAGKRGPSGRSGNRGLPGPIGPPGVVNYSQVENIIERKVTRVFTELRNEIATLERNLMGVINNDTKSSSCGDYGFSHVGKCFSLIGLGTSYNLTYTQAIAMCTANGMALAEFKNKREQVALQGFLRKSMPSPRQSVSEIWIGMTYSKSTLLLRSGKKIASNQVLWHPRYPSESGDVVAMIVRRPRGGPEGIWNSSPSQPLQGVMCEKPMRYRFS